MPTTTTSEGWSSRFIARRTRIARGMIEEINIVMKEIDSGDYDAVPRETMLALAALARRIANKIESRFPE
jgi:hypothetical protein